MLEISLTHPLSGFDLDVTLSAGPGVTALFGPSGAGKTTVINAVAGLMRPAKGRIAVGDQVLLDTARGIDLPPAKRRIGYVFQEPRLFPHLDVRGNLNYGARRAPAGATGPDFDAVIAMLGIAPLLTRRVAALSGGEKARVAIGRALLSKPRLLLMDEPLAALDQARRDEILPFLERLRETGMPVIYVSHALSEVARLADTVALIRAGKLVASGETGAVLSDPDHASALGSPDVGAVLTTELAGLEPDGMARLTTPGGPLFLTGLDHSPGTALRIRIRASDVILSRARPEGLSALNILSGRISRIRRDTAGRAFVQLRLEGDGPATPPQHLLASVTQRSLDAMHLQEGQPCHAIVKAVAVDRRDMFGM